MRKLFTKRSVAIATGALFVSAGVGTAAFGLPWDTDMADGQAKKGYSQQNSVTLSKKLRSLPAGVVAQTNVLSPLVSTAEVAYATPNAVRGTDAGNALVNPVPVNDATLALGEKMYMTNCSFCHGKDGVNLGPVAMPGRFPGVVPLAGPAGVAKLRNDGWIYLTIRNGGAVMPNYGWAMSDKEMWSIVHYIRNKMPNAAAPKPVPAPEPSVDGADGAAQ